MNTIEFHRRRKRIPVVEIARRLGVSRCTVYNWQSEETIPDWATMQTLAELLEVPLEDLFDRDVIGWARVNERRKNNGNLYP